MKLFIVISDTHGDVSAIRKVKAQYPQAHGIIHLGDYIKDALIIKNEFPETEHLMVPGNCDFVMDLPQERVLDIEGKKLFLTHGHHYNVKSGTSRLEAKASSGGYDAVLFGHTHVPLYKRTSSVLILNPGSLCYPRGISGPTYALLEISRGDLQARIMDL